MFAPNSARGLDTYVDSSWATRFSVSGCLIFYQSKPSSRDAWGSTEPMPPRSPLGKFVPTGRPLEKFFLCLTGPYLTRRATIGRLELPLGRGRFVDPPLREAPTSITAVSTPYPPPLPTPRTPLFRRGSSGGCRRIYHGEDLPVLFTARPRMGGRRAVGRRCRGGPRRDRPLMGSRPRPPPEGEGGDEVGFPRTGRRLPPG